MKDFYNRYYDQYMAADTDLRAASREHWIRVHKKNLASGRKDMIIFSAQILAQIELAEHDLNQ